MKIPEFNRTEDFLGYVDIPCLFAKVKNSELPGVAFRHIAECDDDSGCKVYLHGRKEFSEDCLAVIQKTGRLTAKSAFPKSGYE